MTTGRINQVAGSWGRPGVGSGGARASRPLAILRFLSSSRSARVREGRVHCPWRPHFTRFATVMSSRGFTDARSRQGPPQDIKLQSAAEKAGDGWESTIFSLFPGSLFFFSPFSSQTDPAAGPTGARARGGSIDAAVGGVPTIPPRYPFSSSPRLAARGSRRPWTYGVLLVEPVQGPNAYNVELRVFFTRADLELARDQPPHIYCKSTIAPSPRTPLKHADQGENRGPRRVHQFPFPFTRL